MPNIKLKYYINYITMLSDNLYYINVIYVTNIYPFINLQCIIKYNVIVNTLSWLFFYSFITFISIFVNIEKFYLKNK